MSDWKLRRQIREGTFPVGQDHEGGPFLLDVRDLGGYVENHKLHARFACLAEGAPGAGAIALPVLGNQHDTLFASGGNAGEIYIASIQLDRGARNRCAPARDSSNSVLPAPRSPLLPA
jgi:hypothetical protein